MNSSESLSVARHLWGAKPAVSHPTTAVRPRTAARRPTVRAVLREWGPWLCCMALMGVCDDGIPLAMRLHDPKRAGHYLFYGQDDRVLATLVEPILYSMTVQEWGPEHWQFLILSEQSTEWQVERSKHCKGVISPHERDGNEVIPAMAGLMEQRSFGRHRGPQYVVVLHDLGRYWKRLSEDARYDLVPLLQRGHEFGVHVVASVRYEHYHALPQEVRRLFRQKVYGFADDAHLPNTSAFRDMTNMLYYDLMPYQAWVRSGGEWMRYTAPRLG
ncbi:MAG TPA: hypothetical protein ENJ54_07385 [Chloroflexi bacterium]|nr:hypothetical protein [Chloroflexota bacterium]